MLQEYIFKYLCSTQKLAEQELVSGLRKLAKNADSRFSCGGELPSPDQFQLVYESKSGELCKVVFPGASDAGMEHLLDPALLQVLASVTNW